MGAATKAQRDPQSQLILDAVLRTQQLMTPPSSLIDELGDDQFREVITDVLTGTGIKHHLQHLTRRRMWRESRALKAMFDELRAVDGLCDTVLDRVGDLLIENPSGAAADILWWMVNRHRKSAHEIGEGAASREEGVRTYIRDIKPDIDAWIEQARPETDRERSHLIWEFLEYLAMSTHPTSVRGSDKSRYGKQLEKAVLGSALSAVGLRFDPERDLGDRASFWLTTPGERRESDATARIPGHEGGGPVSVTFDIGFIGRRNSEISLDKLTRYEHSIEIGGTRHQNHTMIIVSELPATGRVREFAEDHRDRIRILEMTSNTWVGEMARALREWGGHESRTASLGARGLRTHIARKAQSAPLARFLAA